MQPSPRQARICRAPSFRRLALLSAVFLACTTVRTPVSTISPQVEVGEDRTATPQLELWVESDRPLTPAESEQYREQARSALEQALRGRPAPPEGEVLVLRAQGITRTSGHRHDQAAATAGIAVGAIVIVAAVVVLAVASTKGGGGKSKSSPSASAPRRPPRVPVSRPAPGAARPVPAGPARHPVPHTALAPGPGLHRHHHDGPAIGWDVGLWWTIEAAPPPAPVTIVESRDLPPREPDEGAPPPGEASAGEEAPAGTERDVAPAPQGPERYTLQAPERLPVDERGFFAGDRLVLEATVLDRDTGEPLRVKRLDRRADPREPRAVGAAVDALLDEEGWTSPPGP